MTLLLVLALWLALGCLTWGVFAAVVRAGRADDAVQLRPQVHVPIQRAVFQPVQDRADSAT